MVRDERKLQETITERREEEMERKESAEHGEIKSVATEPRTAWETSILEERPRVAMETWRPTTGGLLSIITGGFNILTGVLMIVGLSLFTLAGFATFAGIGAGGLLIALGIVSVIGGTYAIRRRMWGMSLAGSIAALFPSPGILLGILSLIFVTLGRREFNHRNR